MSWATLYWPPRDPRGVVKRRNLRQTLRKANACCALGTELTFNAENGPTMDEPVAPLAMPVDEAAWSDLVDGQGEQAACAASVVSLAAADQEKELRHFFEKRLKLRVFFF